MSIAGLIYAGGHGSRLGGNNKALVEVGGRRLLERVHEALAGCSPILVGIGPREAVDSAAIPVEQQIRDLEGRDLGPIGALAAAVEWLGEKSDAEWLVTAAVDTPFFPQDFAARAAASVGHAGAAIAAYGDQLYPTNTLWRLAAISDLPMRVRAGTAPNAPKKLAAEIGYVVVDYMFVSGNDPFSNVNTEADLLSLEARAKL